MEGTTHTHQEWVGEPKGFITVYEEPAWNREMENNHRKDQRYYCQRAINDYEKGTKWYDPEPPVGSVFGWLGDQVKLTDPLIRKQPKDVTFFPLKRGWEGPVRNDLVTRGYAEIKEGRGLYRQERLPI